MDGKSEYGGLGAGVAQTLTKDHGRSVGHSTKPGLND